MLFLNPPQNADDIRGFCGRFNESIRVEYKSNLDQNVRRALPKVLSSFANSLGGVLVIGVDAQNGVPVQPIQGFPTPNEEVPLTIENICLQNTYPPIFPRIHMVPSDVQGMTFVVVEVEESWEAPHAIENSTKVYVRTGNASEPYQLANVDLVIELVRRRAEPLAKRGKLIASARRRAETVVRAHTMSLEVTIGPSYPRHAICTRDALWNFLWQSMFRGAAYFPHQTLRRVEDGVASYNRNQEYGQVSVDGILLLRREMRVDHDENQRPVIHIREFVLPFIRLLHCAQTFYRAAQYRGELTVDLSAAGIYQQSIQFLANQVFFERDDFLCFEDTVFTRETIQAEQLDAGLADIVQTVIRQLCWSFWQSAEAFPVDALRVQLADVLQRMGV